MNSNFSEKQFKTGKTEAFKFSRLSFVFACGSRTFHTSKENNLSQKRLGGGGPAEKTNKLEANIFIYIFVNKYNTYMLHGIFQKI